MRPTTAALIVVLGATLPAAADTWNVTTLAQLQTAVAGARPGDLILVQPGTYAVTASQVNVRTAANPANPITVRGVRGPGGARPVLDAAGQDINRGILYIWPEAHDRAFEDLEFRNARGGASYSQNAAAAYVRGDRIVIRGCWSHDNDNGWFSTDESEDVLLEGCETAFNGTGNGFTHNHYMNSQSSWGTTRSRPARRAATRARRSRSGGTPRRRCSCGSRCSSRPRPERSVSAAAMGGSTWARSRRAWLPTSRWAVHRAWGRVGR